MLDSTATTAHIEPFSPPVHRPRRYRSARRHFKGDRRAAVVRAITGARLLATGQVATLAEAATSCGSCPQYVSAAVVLLKAENPVLLDTVLAGHVPLLVAARRWRGVARLVSAYRTADTEDHAVFGTTIGAANLWDAAIVPQL